MTDKELAAEGITHDSDSLIHAMAFMIEDNIDIDIEKDALETQVGDIEKDIEVMQAKAEMVIEQLDAILTVNDVDKFEPVYKIREGMTQ